VSKLKTRAILISMVFLGVLSLVGALGIGSVKAQGGLGYSNIIQKLVDRFGLKTEEVQQVFDQERTERQGQIQLRFQERLDQAVKDGKITEEQKRAILDKKAEMQADCQNSQGLNPDERRTNMETHRRKMQAWVEESGIDPTLSPVFWVKDVEVGLEGLALRNKPELKPTVQVSTPYLKNRGCFFSVFSQILFIELQHGEERKFIQIQKRSVYKYH